MFGQQSNLAQIKSNLFSVNNSNATNSANLFNQNTQNINKGRQIFKTQNNNPNFVPQTNQMQANNVFESNIRSSQMPEKNSGKSIFAGTTNMFANNMHKVDAMMEDTRPQNNTNESSNFPIKSGQMQQSGRNLFEKSSMPQSSFTSISQPQISTHAVVTNIFQSTSSANINSNVAFNPVNIFGSNNLLNSNPMFTQPNVSNTLNNNMSYINNDLMMDDWDSQVQSGGNNKNEDKENKFVSHGCNNMNVGDGQSKKNIGTITLDQFEEDIRKEYNIIKII